MRILLVDDDPAVLRAIARTLRTRGGMEVVPFTSAAAALEHVALDAAFDAVVTDYRMPGMDGEVFLHVLAEIAPAIARAAVMLSGQAGSRSARAVVQKPIVADELLAAIRGVREAAGRAA